MVVYDTVCNTGHTLGKQFLTLYQKIQRISPKTLQKMVCGTDNKNCF